MKHVLCRSDPWSKQPCRISHCTTCTGNEKFHNTCKIRSLVYQNKCKLCECDGKVVGYIGETGRTMPERTAEHHTDALNREKSSHIRQHIVTDHPEQLENLLDLFMMTSLKSCSSALQRQVREAVEIASDSSHSLLNNKEEYSRCVLPVLKVEGPKTAEQQHVNEQIQHLTQEEEERALQVARFALQKRARQNRCWCKKRKKFPAEFD